jgi:hypothetical protein
MLALKEGTYIALMLAVAAGALFWALRHRRYRRQQEANSGDAGTARVGPDRGTVIATAESGQHLEAAESSPSALPADEAGCGVIEQISELETAVAQSSGPKEVECIPEAPTAPEHLPHEEAATASPVADAEKPAVEAVLDSASAEEQRAGTAGVAAEKKEELVAAPDTRADTAVPEETAILPPPKAQSAEEQQAFAPAGPAVTAAGGNQTRAEDAVGQNVDVGAGRLPQRYRPPVRRASRPVNSPGETREPGSAAAVEVVSEIRVHLKFERLGFCNFTLLLEHEDDVDGDVCVRSGKEEIRLLAQDDWYQDLALADIGRRLREGLELAGQLQDGRRARWLLTGRDLYVLTSHPGVAGLLSTNRLALGRSHVVLCIHQQLDDVEKVLREGGCAGYAKLDESHGVPAGWMALRGVQPTSAIALDPGVDPFYTIKPAPDIEIELEGGLWLRHSAWVAGYPPQIRLLGHSSVPVKVLIDSKEARRSDDGSFTVPGYDAGGGHIVDCEGLSCSKSYSIEEPPGEWERWPAHCFGGTDMCGPLVEINGAAASMGAITVPMSNPLLLGAQPGEIFCCSRRTVARWKGYVPFAPVWALPSYPLTSNKKTVSIIQMAGTPVLNVGGPYSRDAFRWSNAILDAGRKGLQIENESPASRTCWRQYKSTARRIWRSSR